LKKILIALLLALLLTFSFSSAVFAQDPIVSVDVDTPSGSVTVDVDGIDTSAWHPGSIGQSDTFSAAGGFTASFDVYAGSYGSLASYVNADGAYGTGAVFTLDSFQDFNVLSANHIYNNIGSFQAVATGVDDNVAMNLKTAGSMYVWSEATNPYWQPGLQGSSIYKSATMSNPGAPTAKIEQWISTDGLATMYNSNIWGWGIYESGALTTNYGGGVRTVTATGNGESVIQGYGNTSFSGVTAWTAGNGAGTSSWSVNPGAFAQVINFVNGITGTYSASAN